MKTNAIGLTFTLIITMLASLLVSNDAVLQSTEMMNRTNVGFASIVLALASGAAAVLSLTMGASSALVGVMVAVALMPPAVTLGLTLGNGQFDLAYGTFLLLATNVVCVNLAALAIFRLKGIKPRTWYEEKNAQKASRTNGLIWLGMLIILAGLIWLRQAHLG
ncbi:MAG TPA: TIGR00341 family protein, partial [Alphaproteobacteria bacterium]|nr:TIGR00341 family protein [Alphaproteobacteria bacterium]